MWNRIVLVLKSVFALAYVHSGLLALTRWLQGPRILVLAYHRVTPDAGISRCAYPAMHVSVSSFEAQMRTLAAHWKIVSPAALRAILKGDRPLRKNVALVTFDDGYQDNFTHAMPVLIRHRIPATFFLSYAFVERREPFWFDRLAAAAEAWKQQSAVDSALRQGLPAALAAALDMEAPTAARLRAAAGCLKKLPDDDRLAALQRLEAAFPLAAGRAEPLAWDEVKEMRRYGMDFGAHGVSHGILTQMSPEAVAREVATSLAGTAERLGATVEAFAYPNGDASAAVASLARQAGATLAFTMEPRLNHPHDDPWRLGRFNVCEDTSRSAFAPFSASYFLCEISGVFTFLLGRRFRGGSVHA